MNKSLLALALLVGTSAFGGNNQLLCESQNRQTENCNVTVSDVEKIKFDRQISNTPCVEGLTYTVRRSGVQVRGGCRAYFKVLRTPRLVSVRCESQGYSAQNCPVNGEIVSLNGGRQLSNTRCVEGQNYGRNGDNSIWVSNGCRAVFNVFVRPWYNL